MGGKKRYKPIQADHPFRSGPNADLLYITLSAAVPLWIEELKCKPYDYVQERARVCGDTVAEKGDIIQFRSKKKGETAKAFNALAEGIACLAFSPGGVKFGPLHFEAEHAGLG
jgi:hypothetical protein